MSKSITVPVSYLMRLGTLLRDAQAPLIPFSESPAKNSQKAHERRTEIINAAADLLDSLHIVSGMLQPYAPPTQTLDWGGKPYPIIASCAAGYHLIAHPNGPALSDGDYLSSIDPNSADRSECLRLKYEAVKKYREWSWPQIKSQFFP